MFKSSMINSNSEFAGYKIVGKLSQHHDGVREVYQAVDCDGRSVALTVFNLRSRRYAADRSARKRQPDFIEEVRFYKECAAAAGYADVMGLPKYLGCGIDTYCHHRYGWLTQEFIDGDSLDAEVRRQGVIPLKDALEIVRIVSFIVDAVARFTRGGGHYNISADNIIVRYEGDELKDVRLVGFTNIGTAYSGNSPIDGEIDNRFRAPETYKHIYSYRSDIYSLGMLLLLMLTGYPKVIHTEHYSIDIGAGTTDIMEVSSMDFYKALWKNADKNLSKALRLVLRKATDISPAGRFATIEKFNEFLAKIEKQELKTHTITEETKPKRATTTFGYRGGLKPAVPFIETSGIIGTTNPLKKNESEGEALDEVAGMADLKALFRRDFIRIVRNPKVAQAYGIKPSNCTLLYGPQGCGKTFIAEKAAQESGLKYKIVKPSELGSIYVHGSQKKIAELFAEAEKNGPMILIFDEFDAIVPKRDSDLNGNQANEVNEMLTQLNNCASRGIYVLATTNRPSLLDPAIMRKGRIDRTVYVSLPDNEARAELFRIEIEKRPNIGIDYELLAKATENYTGSDIAFIVEESARLCFEETLDRQLREPLPLSMTRLLDVIQNTHSSVSETQRKEYLELKAKMEDKQADNGRKKVGFVLG
ncbi:AAA family ATPase [Bacteroides acidifaciens]|uniref:AAA family ATPase n=1 Tax=Bacteroides acidifaciens TaxID=85831 RepID=UPI0026065B39|nr:AAA family ATPase [Bacteroides acidifaciens]